MCNAGRLAPNNEVQDRRQPGRRGRVDRDDPARPGERLPDGRRRLGDRGGEAQPEARRDRQAAARGLDGAGPLPLLVRAQVPRDRARRGRAASPRAARCRSPRPRSRSSSTTSATPSTPRRGSRAANVLEGFGNAFAGPRRLAQPGDRVAQPAVRRTCGRSRRRCPTRPPASSLLPGARRRGAHRRPGRGRERRALHQRGDRLRRDLRRRGGAQGHDLRGRRDARDGHPSLPVQQPFLRDFAEVSRLLRPGRPRPPGLAAGAERAPSPGAPRSCRGPSR